MNISNYEDLEWLFDDGPLVLIPQSKCYIWNGVFIPTNKESNFDTIIGEEKYKFDDGTSDYSLACKVNDYIGFVNNGVGFPFLVSPVEQIALQQN